MRNKQTMRSGREDGVYLFQGRHSPLTILPSLKSKRRRPSGPPPRLIMIAVMLMCAFAAFGDTFTWEGTTNSDWDEPLNWSGYLSPFPSTGPGETSGASDTVTILETGPAFWPVLSGTDRYFVDLTIEPGASMNMGGVLVHIGGALNIQAALGNVTNFDTLELTGSGPSTVNITNGISIADVNVVGSVQLLDDLDDLHVSSNLNVYGTLDLNGKTAGVAATVTCNNEIVFNNGSIDCGTFATVPSTILNATGGARIVASGTVDLGSVTSANFTYPNLCSLEMSGIADLTVNASTPNNLGSLTVTSTGGVTLQSSLMLAGDLTITSGGSLDTNANSVALNGTARQTVTLGTATTLDVLTVANTTGPIAFSGALTITSGGLSVTTPPVELNGTISVGGSNLNLGSVTLTGGPSGLSTTSSGNIALGAVTNASAQALTVNAAGSVTFSGAVGGGTPSLASLDVTGPGGININGGAVTTNGPQIYRSDVTLGAPTTVLNSGTGAMSIAAIAGGGNALTLRSSGTTGTITVSGNAANLDTVTLHDAFDTFPAGLVNFQNGLTATSLSTYAG
ncbi:MAG: autotransporter adhesin family protein, partial [Treponema sp.]|nr:autotransporter adhesin family protein [Treponema sp.]